MKMREDTMFYKFFCALALFFFVASIDSRTLKTPPMIVNRQMVGVNYGTHLAPLIIAVINTDGPVLELGCGDFSTPILHAVCSSQKRFLLTAESDGNWQKRFWDLKRDWHKFQHVKHSSDWNQVGAGRHWSVVFVDHAPGERRVVDIARLRRHADIFVVHDTETASYGYEPVLSTFKYIFVYRRYSTTTTLVSDTIDVALLFND